MKKFLFILMALWAFTASAQDVIIKKDGSTIVSKVLEITSTEVKYKKFTYQNGPTYTIPKTEILTINYENGEKETFGEVKAEEPQQTQQFQSTNNTPINAKPFSGQGVSDRELMRMAGMTDPYLNKAKNLKIVGWTVGPALFLTGTFLIGWSFGNSDFAAGDIAFGCLGIAGGLFTTIVCSTRAKKLKAQSTVQSAPLYHQDFALRNGSSLSTGVDVLSDSRLHTQTVGLGIRYNF